MPRQYAAKTRAKVEMAALRAMAEVPPGERAERAARRAARRDQAVLLPLRERRQPRAVERAVVHQNQEGQDAQDEQPRVAVGEQALNVHARAAAAAAAAAAEVPAAIVLAKRTNPTNFWYKDLEADAKNEDGLRELQIARFVSEARDEPEVEIDILAMREEGDFWYTY